MVELLRREFIGFVLASVLPADLVASSVRQLPIDPDLVQGVLEAGKWTSSADDNGGSEQLPEEFIKTIVETYKKDPANPSQNAIDGLGVLVLTLSVGEWGVSWKGKMPDDPAKDRWLGPKAIMQGKHLMSYALGGIGIPHLDVDGAQRFLREVGRRYPAAVADLAPFTDRRTSFHYDRVRAAGGLCAANPQSVVIMSDLDGKPFDHGAVTYGGAKYCQRFNLNRKLDPRQWQTLRHWCRLGLRDKAIQAWVVQDWLDRVWMPTYRSVMDRRVPGSVLEAFVLARIVNTSNGALKKALEAAGQTSDPERRIEAELANYAGKNQTHIGRVGLMRRPGAVFDHFS
ncbi:hypothetical protein [Rhizobium ruizarguesonis]|uniref:hypothetical protein n=1 Tax=Rhizobium ruizarguesonis TaxID=2081791 RepID=UPI001032665C|nr:hypothetical protein [Rhizobium ruizarguesonis]TAZ23407.1 hypothetical protein ELH74_37765 [Rhizobium ruizarguesonis]TBD07714.1 hypothetical protein ELH23_39045 [Rhizobium ruizarguesonis]